MIAKAPMTLFTALSLTPALAVPAPASVSLEPSTINKRVNDFSSPSPVELSTKYDNDLPISSDFDGKGYLFLEASPFRGGAPGLCNALVAGLQQNGQASYKVENAEMSNFYHPNTLDRGVPGKLEISMSLADDGKKAAKDICLRANENYGTKWKGFTKELKYWKGFVNAGTTSVKGGKANLKHDGKDLESFECMEYESIHGL